MIEVYSTVLIFLLLILSLIIGSFLNVVIYRLPLMMQGSTQVPFNLVKPRSHCPDCKKKIPAYLNIPILGYFLIQGKCYVCANRISVLYPFIELLSLLFAGFIIHQFGISFETLAALVFTWILIPLIWIDIKHQLLPDFLTLPGIWLGLFVNVFDLFTPITSAVIGAMIGYASLWLIAKLFKSIKKQDGIGYGDFKLFALLGAWLGWQKLPIILFQASLFGFLISFVYLLYKKQKLDTPIAFGPYLAISGWVTLFFEEKIGSLFILF